MVSTPLSELPDGTGVGSRLKVDDAGRVGVVKAVEDGHAQLDLNHPLAGQTLHFKVTLLECTTPDAASEVSITHQYTAGDLMTFPLPGDVVQMHYTGWSAETEKQFDCSEQRNKPLTFTVGEGKVIAGLEDAAVMMSQGQRVVLQVPRLKGKDGLGGKFDFKPPFPPEGDLVFELELLKVKRGKDNIN
eukprot:TRINITY_DN2269_c0_g1_i18.p1 TRINITY_DN2269_c0_g1~~TRINITY_DN2269_c0_g1_i18.p1  ORF type:complete len:188 (-),score=52.39 TRINITY_DN2269_c0_g1_i18:1218-1781(-)